MTNAEIILQNLDQRLNAKVEITLYGRAALQLGFPAGEDDFARSQDIDGILWLGQAEELLRKVLALPMQPQEREGALLMLASAALTKGDAKQAADVAAQLVEASPQNTDGWKLLISAKQQQKLSSEASEIAKRSPPGPSAKLQDDPDFIALLAAVEDASGETDANV